jgi:hypothetical protein
VCELTRDGLSSDRRDVRDGSQLCAFMKILAVLNYNARTPSLRHADSDADLSSRAGARHTTAHTHTQRAQPQGQAPEPPAPQRTARQRAPGTCDAPGGHGARGSARRRRSAGAEPGGTGPGRGARERTRRGQPGAGPSCILDSAAWSCHAGPAALVRTELGAGAWVTTFVASCADARSPPYWPPRWSPPPGARP